MTRIDPESGKQQPFELHCATCGLLDSDIEAPTPDEFELGFNHVRPSTDDEAEDYIHLVCSSEAWVSDPQEA